MPTRPMQPERQTVSQLPAPTFHDCLVGARRWIERGLAEAHRLNDRQCETEFQAILDTFDSEASGLNDIIAEANAPRDEQERPWSDADKQRVFGAYR